MTKKDLKEMFGHAFGNFLGIALAIAFYFILLRFSTIVNGFDKVIKILSPFVVGGVMAFVLKTPCNFFEEIYRKYLPNKLKKKKTGLAVFTVMLLSIIAIYTLIRTVVPQMIVSIATLSRSVPRMTRQFFDWTDNYLKNDGVVQSYIRPIVVDLMDEASNWASGDVLPHLQNMVGDVTYTISSIVGLMMNLVIGTIVCIYTLCARKTFARQGRAVIYAIFKAETADRIVDEVHFINETFDGFISGKVLDSAVVGLICYAFCMILAVTRGFSNSVLISIIIGVTNIIPYFGPFIGAVPAVLLIAISNPVNAVIFLIFIVILQQFDGNVLGPRLLAGSVGLSGFWVLFSITLFSGIFGFAGVLVGVPVFAVIYDLLRKLVVKGLKKNGKLDVLARGEEEPEKKEQPKEKKNGLLDTILSKKNS